VAYRIKKGIGGAPTTATSDGLITKSSILQMISSNFKGTDLYIMEPVEVLEVLQGDTFPDNYEVELSDGKKVEDYAYVGAIKGRYCYSRQGEEKGFGKDGSPTYSIWLYKGGPRCQHRWLRKTYVTKEGSKSLGKLLTTTEARKRGFKPEANEQEVPVAPKDMPFAGYTEEYWNKMGFEK